MGYGWYTHDRNKLTAVGSGSLALLITFLTDKPKLLAEYSHTTGDQPEAFPYSVADESSQNYHFRKCGDSGAGHLPRMAWRSRTHWQTWSPQSNSSWYSEHSYLGN